MIRRIGRRAFIRTVIGLSAAVASLVRAQTRATMRRIGVLSPGQGPSNDEFDGSVAALRELGWIEGKNIIVESRFAKGRFDELRPLADELVRLGAEIIVTFGTPAALAAKNATRSIPIVMGTVGDPVDTGLVASPSRPGGNVTGYSIVGPEVAAKRAGIVHELLPAATRVAVVVPPKGFSNVFDLIRKETDAAYRSLGVQPIFIEVVPLSGGFEKAVAEAVQQRAQALELPGENVAGVITAALGHRLPVIVKDRRMLEAGGLLFLDVDNEDRSRRVAAMIDKILRGAKPADIPIEQPTRYELAINLKTARALGITVPQSLLLRANQVIR